MNVSATRTLLLSTLLLGIIPTMAIFGQETNNSYPQVTLSNDVVEMDLYLPDADRGYYRGCRFDWSGVVSRLTYNGHNFFGEWQNVDDPTFHDRICGPVESFQTDGVALGYEEAKVGEGFVKIGIGVLKKPRQPRYEWAGKYEIIDPGTWTVTPARDRIKFQHALSGPRGWGYHYTKQIVLTREPPGFTIDHILRNTGSKVIDTDQYNHNFFVIDGQATGPDFTLTFPFKLTATDDVSSLLDIQGKQLTFRSLLEDRYVFTGLEGFGPAVDDHQIVIENRKTGAGVRFSVDRPLSKMNFWSIRTTICPENFVLLKIAPNEQQEWRSTYILYSRGEQDRD
jgi:hypothetical protein